MSEPEFKKWYVTECSTPDCWCRCIGTDPDSDDMEDCIVPSGAIGKDNAEQVVAEHNERPGLLKTINDLRRELAEAKERIAELEREESETSRVLINTRNLAAEKMRQANSERDAARAEAGRYREALERVSKWSDLDLDRRNICDLDSIVIAALATPAADAGGENIPPKPPSLKPVTIMDGRTIDAGGETTK